MNKYQLKHRINLYKRHRICKNCKTDNADNVAIPCGHAVYLTYHVFFINVIRKIGVWIVPCSVEEAMSNLQAEYDVSP